MSCAQLRTPRRSVSFSAASVQRTPTNTATGSGDALLLPFEGAPASHPHKDHKDTKGPRTLTDAVVDAVWELLADEKSATFRTPAADNDSSDQRILLQHYAVRHYPEFLASSLLQPSLAAQLRAKPLTKRALKDFLDHISDALVLQKDVLLNLWVLLERFLMLQKDERQRKDQKNKMCLRFTQYSWPLVVMAALMCAVPAYEDNGPSLYEYAVAVKEWAGFAEFYGLRLVVAAGGGGSSSATRRHAKHANTFLPAVGCGGGGALQSADSCFPFPSCLQPSFALAVVFNKLLPQKLFSRKNLMRAQLQFLDAIGWRAFVRPEDWLGRYEGLLQRVELPDEDKNAEEAAEVAAELRRKRLQLMFENGAGQEGADGHGPREGVLLNGRSSGGLASAAPAAAGDYTNNRKSNRSQIFRTADDCAISSPTCDWDNGSIVSSEAKTPERTSFLRRCSPADDDDGAICSPERARNARASFVFQPAGRVSSDLPPEPHSSARRAPSAMRRCSAKRDSAARAPSHDKLLLFTSSDENNAPPSHVPPRKRSSKESIALSTHPRLSATQTARPSDQVPSLFAFNKMRRCRSDQIAASWAAADHGHQSYGHDGESSHPLMRARHRDWSQRSLVSLWRERASMPMFVGEADEEPEGALTKTRFRQIRESFDDLNRALGKEGKEAGTTRTSSKNGGGGAGQGVGWLQGRGSEQSGSSQNQGGRISNDDAMFDVAGQVPADAGENAVETTAAAGSGSGLLGRSTLTRSSTSKPIATNKGCLAAKESLSTTASRLTRTTLSYYGRNTAGTVSFRQSVLDRAARESCCVASGQNFSRGAYAPSVH